MANAGRGGYNTMDALASHFAHCVLGLSGRDPSESQAMQAPEGKRGTVLLADDDDDFAEAMQELLEAEGYVVRLARNGKEAVDQVRANGIDVLVLDLRMPFLSGLYVCLELKKMGRFLPTIIVTAHAEEESHAVRMLKAMPVAEILRKPFDPAWLLGRINALVSGGDSPPEVCSEGP